MSVVYDKVGVILRTSESKDGPLAIEDAKRILGWESEADSEKEFGTEYLFRDLEGNKVRLTNNPSNRPFRMTLARRYQSEMLRKKWRLNGEPIILDRKGHVQSGQHRLVGLILAEQERLKNPAGYRESYGWRSEVAVDALIVTGISDKAEVVDTLDLGQKRSLGDVIFRRDEFGDLSEKEQKRLSNVLGTAARLAWLRIGGRVVSDAPHFPHSEALDFIEAHPRLKDSVNFVFTEDGGTGAEGKRISSLISLGYAGGLLYLMATAKTDPDKFEEKGTDAIKYSLWDKACEFWTLLASGAGLEKGNPILSLRNMLHRMDAGGATARDEVVGVVVKAWNLWIDGKDGEAAAIKVKKTKDDLGRLVLAETPRIGGLDVERDVVPDEDELEGTDAEAEEGSNDGSEEAPAKKKGKAKGKRSRRKAKGPEVGEWVWVKDPDGDHWKGKVLSLDGDAAVLKADSDGKEYAAEVKDLFPDKPEDE